MLLDIVILPSEDLSRTIGKQAQALRKRTQLIFSVDNKKLFAHISLLHISIKKAKLKNLFKQASTLAEAIKPFIISLSKIETDSRGWVSLGLKKSKKLIALQKKILRNISNLRDKNWHEDYDNRIEKKFLSKSNTR